MDIKASINATKIGFEESFSSADFYNKQTQDSVHLKLRNENKYAANGSQYLAAKRAKFKEIAKYSRSIHKK